MIRTRLRTRGGGGGGFSPSQIPNLALWLDAADTATITQSGGSVSQWNDKSGNANHATQSTGARQPLTGTRIVNGKNVLDFTTSHLLVNNSGVYSLGDSACTVFVVFAFDNPTASNDMKVWQIYNGAEDYGAWRQVIQFEGISGNMRVSNNTGPSPKATSLGSDNNSNNRIAALTFNGTADLAGYFNGSQHMTTTTTGGASTGTCDRSFIFGSIDGYVAEVEAYSKLLSTSQLNQVGQYLANKWGGTWTTIP